MRHLRESTRLICILLSLALLLTFSSAHPYHNWIWMDCNHGYFYIQNYTAGDFICVCDEGWTGVDCSLCDVNYENATNLLCPEAEKCTEGVAIGFNNAYSCLPTNQGQIQGLGALTAQFTFSNGNSNPGIGELSAYAHDNGAPFMFNCSFTDCLYSETSDQTHMTVSCGINSCFCTTWCGDAIVEIINNMKEADFSCDLTTNNCVFQPISPPLIVEVACNASGCRGPPQKPPLKSISAQEATLAIVGSVVTFITVIVAIALACTLVLRRKQEEYLSLDDSTFSATITWQNLSCVITKHKKSKKKILLNDISGSASPGQITAILGPSGAGKTTFLDILAGRKNIGTITGKILINDRLRPRNFSQISAYVMQEDKMLGTFTVREHLNCIAALRLPSGMPWIEKNRRVNEVLEDLGIMHIAESLIGTEFIRGISGGEKRRLSIASELVTDPSILFLDEPTSGLDSFSAHSLMDTLSTLARNKNRTIITTIHQPRSDIYAMFDNVILLAGGNLMYWGPGDSALDFFKRINQDCPPHYNPADHMIDVVTKNPSRLEEFSNEYKSYYLSEQMRKHKSLMRTESFQVSSPESYDINPVDMINGDVDIVYESGRHANHYSLGESGSPESVFKRFARPRRFSVHIPEAFHRFGKEGEYSTVWFEQVWVLCKRTLLHNVRNPYLLRAQYILTIILAILLGMIFYQLQNNLQGVQDRAGAIFFIIALFAFGSLSSIDVFYHERAIFLRERASGMYRTSSYFIAKALCDVVPMRVIPPMLLGAIVYYMIGFREGWNHFLIFESTLVLSSLVAASLCLAISASAPSLSLGNLVAILLMLFFMLFGGFLVNKTSMPPFIGWLKWTSFLCYSFEILMVNELDGLTIIFAPKAYNVSVPVDGEVFLEQFDLEAGRMSLDYFALVAMSAFYMFGAYLFLRFTVRERR